MHTFNTHSTPIRLIGGLLAALLLPVSLAGHAQDVHQHHAAPGGRAPAPFIASTAKSFAQLMDDAMGVMDYGMRAAPMNREPNHDFVTMMIPHHQGAVDMAKALLLYTNYPQLRNLAQGIITEQQNEIRLMQAWLQRYQDTHKAPAGSRQP